MGRSLGVVSRLDRGRYRHQAEERKSNADRRGYDTILKFKMLVLASLYNLSDESLEFQVRYRLSFMRFLGLALHNPVPDATTIAVTRPFHPAEARVVG